MSGRILFCIKVFKTNAKNIVLKLNMYSVHVPFSTILEISMTFRDFLGMYAFGLEETNFYKEAEETARKVRSCYI